MSDLLNETKPFFKLNYPSVYLRMLTVEMGGGGTAESLVRQMHHLDDPMLRLPIILLMLQPQ